MSELQQFKGYVPEPEVHKYFEDGGRVFEFLAASWYPAEHE